MPPPSRIDRGTELFIDALRGIAALMVFGTHAVDLAISRVYGWGLNENPTAWRLVRAVFGTGEHWVWCFFVVSGFCIQLSIARGLREGSFRLWPYIVARVSRIYPLYLVGLVLAIVTVQLVPSIGGYDGSPQIRQLLASLVSLQIFTNTYPAYGPSWSLSCEMIYYGAWPFLLIVAGRRVDWAVKLGMTGSFCLVGGIFFVWALAGHHQIDERAFVDGLWTLGTLFPLWLAGAWLANHWSWYSETVTVRSWRVGMALLSLAAVFQIALKYLQYPQWSIHVAAWLALPGIFLIIAGGRHAKLQNASPKWAAICRWLGQFSYPCYILHVQMMELVDSFGMNLVPEAFQNQVVVRIGMYLVVVLPVLALFGPPVERRLMKWRSDFLSRQKNRKVPVEA